MPQANPFYFGAWVGPEDFCNRTQELAELRRDVDSGINVLLYAPRRHGKTSLLKQLSKELNGLAGYRVVYFDFFVSASPEEFIQQYFSAVVQALSSQREKAYDLLKGILKIRPQVSVSLNPESGTAYTLTFSRSERAMALNDVLQLPQRYAAKRADKVLVIFDEFQEIEGIGLEKKLRSVIQEHGREVSYIFCGSKKSLLLKIFNDSGRAFYRSVKRLHMGPIALSHWEEFIGAKFQSSGKSIDRAEIELIFTLAHGLPYYVQQLCYATWELAQTRVNKTAVEQALQLTLEREDDLYSVLWSDLTAKQRRTLKYLVHSGGEAVYSGDNLLAYDFNASTLKSTLESLQKKDLIDRSGTSYYLVDPFMAHWVRKL